MLKSITKKMQDRSTDQFFKFSFYCDRCGKEWTSEPYSFEHSFSDNLTQAERSARDIMWRTDHDLAFQRANLEARLRFNQCGSCHNIVCDECFAMEEDDDLCVDCASRKNSPDQQNE